MTNDPDFKLSDRFLRSASPYFSQSRREDTPEMAIRRPPVPERKTADFQRMHMEGYLKGLEQRLVRHLELHSPGWHHKEMAATLNKWNAMRFNHPAPHGAVRRNLRQEASEYAADKVEERMSRRFRPIEAVKMRIGAFDDSMSGVMNRAQRRAHLRDKMRF